MSLITKVSTYNAPYEISSSDRFYKDIDNKIGKYQVKDSVKFSSALQSTTTMSLTITDEGKRVSYARIESTIFSGKPVSYWFLTAVSRVESGRATQYSATLDAIATFGDDVFSQLTNKKVKINRLHEDRYTFVNNSNFKLNPKVHSLINSDFKLGDTKGMSLEFSGAVGGGLYETLKINGGWFNIDGPNEGIEKGNLDVDIKNNIDVEAGRKQYWLYALIQLSGEPVIFDGDTTTQASSSNGSGFINFKSDIIRNSSYLRNSIILPVNNDLNSTNSLSILSKLQENKVINIIKLPFQLGSDISEDGFQILFTPEGKRIKDDENGDLSDVEGDNLDPDKTTLYGNLNAKFDLLYGLYGFKEIKSTGDKSIVCSNLGDGNQFIMNFIAKDISKGQMLNITQSKINDELEVGLLNSDIAPINFKIHDVDTEIDMYNFLNENPISFPFKYTINELGLEVTLKISSNQYIEWSENTIMSFTSDQGSTYLARNKYTQDAQRKGIEIQKSLGVVGARTREATAGASAANPISAIMSLGTSLAGGAAQAAYAGQEANLQKKLADNKKSIIQASINDASATAPSIHTGSTHNLSNLNNEEYKYNFNWVMKKPNQYILDKIVNFYDRHGYKVDDWFNFSTGLISNRSKFNYIEMDEFKDFIGTFADFDINVLNLLDAEFKKGVRLWHIDTIDYDVPNYEKVITENV